MRVVRAAVLVRMVDGLAMDSVDLSRDRERRLTVEFGERCFEKGSEV